MSHAVSASIPGIQPTVETAVRRFVMPMSGSRRAAADQRRGDRQHLAHAGAAGGAFIADHQHVAGPDRIRLHGGERGFLAFEHPRRSFVVHAALAGERCVGEILAIGVGRRIGQRGDARQGKAITNGREQARADRIAIRSRGGRRHCRRRRGGSA